MAVHTHIYIAGFSDGVVKIGRTGNPRQRLATLSSESRRRGAVMTRQWVHAHGNARLGEWHLRNIGHNCFKRAWGAEYFRADFDKFVSTVERKFAYWGVDAGLPVDKP